MEKKKTKLTISGTAKKTIKNIEIAKTQAKNSVVIEKSKSNFLKKGSSFRSSGTDTKTLEEMAPDKGFYCSLVVATAKDPFAFAFA